MFLRDHYNLLLVEQSALITVADYASLTQISNKL